jgi:type I restriction enzyme, S subunit
MKIKEICEYGNKSKIMAGDGLKEGKYKFFTSSSEVNKYVNDQQFDRPGIIMGTGGSATIHYCDEPFSVSTDCLVMFPSKILVPKFLYYFFKGNFHVLQAGFKGAGLKHTSKKYINEISIEHIPDITEQLSIVRILDQLSTINEKKTQQLLEYDQLIKSRFVEMFGDKGKEVPLTDYVWFQEGPGVRSVSFKNEGCILLTGSNINDNNITFGYKSDRFISDDLANGAYSHFICDKNDILVVSSAIAPDNFDKKVVVIESEDKYCLNTGIIRFKPNSDHLTVGYFREFLKSMFFKRQVMSEMRGIAQMHFGPSHLSKMNILLPSNLQSQMEFEIFINQVDKLKSSVQKSLDTTQALFDSLMQEYFG